jgi:hypothetical protein
MRSIYSPQRRKERKGLIIFLFSGERERPENKKNQLYKVILIARVPIFVTYLKLKLFFEKVLFYSLPSFLSVGIFGGSTAKNKKKHLCVLRVW